MSKKIKLKRVALVAISAMGLGMLGIAPASAAKLSTDLAVDALTVTTPTVTLTPDAGGIVYSTAASSTFSVSFGEDGDAAKIGGVLVALSKPTCSALTVGDADGGGAGTAFIVTDTGETNVATTAAAGKKDVNNGDQVEIIPANNANAEAADAMVAGTIALTPDCPGTYTVTLTGLTDGGGAAATANAVTATFTVTASPDAEDSAGAVNSISLAQVTATPRVGSSVAINFLANMDNITNKSYDQYVPFTGYLSTYPSGGFTQVGCSTSDPETDTELYVAAGGTSAAVSEGGCSGATYQVILDGDSADEDYTGNTATATNLVGAAQFNFTPTLAGAYVLTVWNDVDEDSKVDIGEAVQTISITVADATAFSAGQSTSIIQTADDNFNAAADEEVRVSKTAGTNGGTIALTLKDAAGAAKGGMRVSAEVSGPGLVDVVTASTVYADATVRADALTLASNVSTAAVHITADGTGGKSTITVKVQDPVTLATLGTYTEYMYFYGSVATLEATANFTVARASATERGCAAATGCDQADFASTPFVQIVAKDAEGNLVPGLTVAASITDPTVVQASTVVAVTETAVSGPNYLTACSTTDCNGLGYYNASVAGTVGAASGKSTTVAYTTTLTSGTVIKSNAVTITIGGSAATGTETLTLDKATYEPGEGMTVTLTAKDSAGNPVYDGYDSPAVSWNKAVGGTAVAASFYVNGKVTSDDSLGRKTIYAPASSGAFIGQATAASLATLTVTATVGDDSATKAANAASDAAAEAIDAANAATDAANLAAEAADAATVAAEEARDAADAATAAVEALATEVATLMAALKAQITTLANTVAKIAKKVKA